MKLPADGYIFSPDVDAANPTRPDSVTQAFTRLCRRMEAPALANYARPNQRPPGPISPRRIVGTTGCMTSVTTRQPSFSPPG